MSGIFWLASYPKSGNTWLRALLTNYLNQADKPTGINELNFSGDGFMRESFDERLGIDSADLTRKQICHYRPLVYEQMVAESSEPLFLKVHDAYEFNDDGQPIFSRRATAGAIYLIRNPLDVAVSYAYHLNKPIDVTVRLMRENTMLTSDLSGAQLPQKLLSWSNHVSSWVDASDLNLLVVRYEDMIGDTVESFGDVVRFAGLDFDSTRIAKAVEFSSFERLRAQELANGFREKQPTAKSFFRRGKTGTWREVLSYEQVNQLIGDHREIMCRFGYLGASGEILY